MLLLISKKYHSLGSAVLCQNLDILDWFTNMISFFPVFVIAINFFCCCMYIVMHIVTL